MSIPPPPSGAPVPPPPPGWQQAQPMPPQFPNAPYYARQGRTSGLAVASMVLGIMWVYWIGSVLAIIFGHVAMSQMKRDPTLRGRGMAIAGVVLGYVGLGLLVVLIVAIAALDGTWPSDVVVHLP